MLQRERVAVSLVDDLTPPSPPTRSNLVQKYLQSAATQSAAPLLQQHNTDHLMQHHSDELLQQPALVTSLHHADTVPQHRGDVVQQSSDPQQPSQQRNDTSHLQTVGMVYYNQKSGKVQWLAIDERFKGQGLGTLLMRVALEHIKAEGASSASLTVTRHDVHRTSSLISFYQRMGFVEEKRMREMNLDLDENGGDDREVSDDLSWTCCNMRRRTSNVET